MKQATFPINKAINIADEFIPSASNNLACSQIESWPEGWGVAPYPNTALLLGEKKSGKSLLAKSWASRARAIILDKNNVKNWMSLVEAASSIVLDDLESFEEEDLLHIFNLCHESKRYLLIVANDNQLDKIKLPDLSSRLNSCKAMRINQADDELIRVLMFKFFSDFSVNVGQELIEYLSKVLPRSTGALISKLELINSYALAKKRKVTIPLVNELLSAGLL